MTKLIKNAKIITMADLGIVNGYAFIKEGQFVEIKEGIPPKQLEATANEVIDANGKWMTPGLINTHGHTGMALLRGHSDDLPLHRWLKEKMWPFEAKQDFEAIKAGREMAIAEMLLSGTTTFLEMYHLFIDEFAEQLSEIGVRATLMRSMIGLCSREEQEEKLTEAVSLAKKWHNHADGRLQMMLAPHAPYTCPPLFIERIVEEASLLQLPVHMHLAETSKEVHDHIESYGVHPFDHLKQLGVLDKVPWLFAHCVHMNEEQIEQMPEYDVSVSYNPKSNLKLGSGFAQIAEMMKKGVNVALGTDSVASNNTLNLFEELRIGVLLQKGLHQDPTVLKAFEAFKIATVNGATALSLNKVGKIQIGYKADFILLTNEEPHLQPNEHVYSHLIYAANGSDVTDVFVQGKQLVKNRQLTTLDQEQIMYNANMAYHRIHHS
ncbi:amidohydrolase [Alkalihalobacillus sp. APA_J-10(15)]|nr:amidohydrolase [Halalkalibacter sp. APA_J-10(15)]